MHSRVSTYVKDRLNRGFGGAVPHDNHAVIALIRGYDPSLIMANHSRRDPVALRVARAKATAAYKEKFVQVSHTEVEKSGSTQGSLSPKVSFA